MSYQRGSHYNAILDPYNATVGIGLGLAGYKPELQTKEAVRLSEQLEIEQTMFEDKLKTTDWEATNEAIEEQIARESYLQWCRENLQKTRNATTTATATTSSASSSSSSATVTSGEMLANLYNMEASPSKYAMQMQAATANAKEAAASCSSTFSASTCHEPQTNLASLSSNQLTKKNNNSLEDLTACDTDDTDRSSTSAGSCAADGDSATKTKTPRMRSNKKRRREVQNQKRLFIFT